MEPMPGMIGMMSMVLQSTLDLIVQVFHGVKPVLSVVRDIT